ncbi:hypothetical protein ACQEUU_19940 [Nonomuraea sp. CA-218870]
MAKLTVYVVDRTPDKMALLQGVARAAARLGASRCRRGPCWA